MGLRHNYAGSTDALNYADDYWNIRTSLPQDQWNANKLPEFQYSTRHGLRREVQHRRPRAGQVRSRGDPLRLRTARRRDPDRHGPGHRAQQRHLLRRLSDHPGAGRRHRHHQRRRDRRRALPGGDRLHARELPRPELPGRHPDHPRAALQVLLRRVHRQPRLQALGRGGEPDRDRRQHDRPLQELLRLQRLPPRSSELDHQRLPRSTARPVLRALHRGVPVLLLLRRRLPGQLPQRRSAARIDGVAQQPGRDPADARAGVALRDLAQPRRAGAAQRQWAEPVLERHRVAGQLRPGQALLHRLQPRLLLPHHARRLAVREARGAAGADHDPVALLPRRHLRRRQPVLDQLLPHLQGPDAEPDLGRRPRRLVGVRRVRQSGHVRPDAGRRLHDLRQGRPGHATLHAARNPPRRHTRQQDRPVLGAGAGARQPRLHLGLHARRLELPERHAQRRPRRRHATTRASR